MIMLLHEQTESNYYQTTDFDLAECIPPSSLVLFCLDAKKNEKKSRQKNAPYALSLARPLYSRNNFYF